MAKKEESKEVQKLNLYEKMWEVMKAVQYMKKDDKVEFGKTNYKAMSEEKVTAIMREQFMKLGLLVFPIEMTHTRVNQLSHVDVKYRIVNAESPEEYIEVVSCGDGADTQDKGAGKAMTYAYKYMWLRTFAIPTGEDPDKISSEELDAKMLEESKIITEKEAAVLKALCERKGQRSDAFRGKPLSQLTAKDYVEASKLLNNLPDKENA